MGERLYALSVAESAADVRGWGLDSRAVSAVGEFLAGPLVQDPYRVGVRLEAPLDEVYSACRGTYRVLYLIAEVERRVQVTAISRRPGVRSAGRRAVRSVAHRAEGADGSGRAEALAALRSHVDSFEWQRMTPARRNILESFMRVAARDGYAAVTMRSLGRELDIQAPSLYSHFPGGRDEIVGEALRFNYFRFASTILAAVEGVDDPGEFWDALVRNHAVRQFTLVQNDMFDLILAADRISGTLPADARREVTELIGLYTNLLVAAAADMGCTGDVARAVRIVTTVTDGVNSWSPALPVGSVQEVAETAVRAARAIVQAEAPIRPVV